MPNYELKAEILAHNPEFVKYIKDENTYTWAKTSLWFDKRKQHELLSKSFLGSHCANVLFNENRAVYDECVRIANADKSRRKRLRKRIELMFGMGDCIFITLTFNDNTLNDTSEQTRRLYVTQFLKSVSDCYIANIDFGTKNGREHYHAVLVSKGVDFDFWSKYGFYKAETVRKDGVDAHRLAIYVSKLTNHAIKNTTKRNALIYSR